jgi:putative ABC transport system permease protein
MFGLITLGLASLGLYGAMSYGVKQRRQEMGVRIALGAPHSSVLQLVLRQGLAPVGVGILLGAATSIGVGQLMAGVLFGVTPIDPVSLAGASGILTLAAATACYLPARQARRIDPLIALREN